MRLFSNRVLLGLCFVIMGSACFPSPVVHAQKGREIVGGLLRELLESEMKRQQQKQRNENPHKHPRPNDHRPNKNLSISTKSQQARGYFKSFGSESQRLAALIEQQARNVPGARSHLDEVLKLHARSEFLNRRYAQPQPDHILIRDIEAMNRDWRSVAYQLNRLTGLPGECRQTIGRIDDINTRCCGLFDLGAQFNQREVVRLADSLAAEIHHLQRDVEFELRLNPTARQLILQLRRIEARAKLLSDSAANGNAFDVVVAEFQRFVREWNGIGHQLESFNDRHIDRTIEQILAINRKLHEQLLLPIGIDRPHLEHLTTLTRKRLKTLGNSFSLSMLIQLPDGAAVIGSAKLLEQEMDHLCDSVARNASEQELFEHWRVLDTAWREFDHYSLPIDSPQIRGLRRDITAKIDAIRQGLGVQLAFDRRAVVHLAAELEGIAEQTHFLVGQWQRRPGAGKNDNLLRASKRLINDCHHFHEECSARATQKHLANNCRKLTKQWSQLRPQLLECKTSERHALRRIADEATSRIIRLQVMLNL